MSSKGGRGRGTRGGLGEEWRRRPAQEIILIVEVADAASPNRKSMVVTGRRRPDGVLVFGIKCFVHQLFRGGPGVAGAESATATEEDEG